MKLSIKEKKGVEKKLIEYLLNNYPEVIKRRENELKINEKISKWYLLGAYIGDFSRIRVNEVSVMIHFTSTNYYGLIWGYRVFSSLGNVSMNITLLNRFGKNLRVALRVTLPRNEYEELAWRKDEIIDYVVRCVEKTGNVEILLDFISGLCDADGNIGYYYTKSKSVYRICLRIFSTKYKWLVRIKELLNKYNYYTRIGRDRKIMYIRTYNTDLLTRLKLLHPEKYTKLESVKRFKKTTFAKEEFEKYVKPYWPKHVRGGSSKWLLKYFPETPPP